MKHLFVEHFPESLEDGVLYISIEYDTAVHACACGCGIEVVTPLSPAQWSLTYNGQSVSLSPSIGNWNFPCKSHYWIRSGRVEWDGKLSKAEIEAVQFRDHADLKRLHAPPRSDSDRPAEKPETTKASAAVAAGILKPKSMLSRLLEVIGLR